jgi:beta-xylosidase
MIDSVMFWNEPNNQSHWDFHMDPDWVEFSRMVRAAGTLVHETNPNVRRVMGGISPIDPAFIEKLREHGALDAVDVVAVHGFPLDWNYWHTPDDPQDDADTVPKGIHAWPRKVALAERIAGRPVWATEVGASSFGGDEMQIYGLRETARYLRAVERVYWYSLFDLPEWREATTRHKEAEGSAYYRHYHMGLVDAAGRPKPALREWPALGGRMGLCQWFHFEDDATLQRAVQWFHELGVQDVRTGLSWADSHRPGGWEWFDRIAEALRPFRVLATLCFTPPSRGRRPDHTSPPIDHHEFAWFCAEVVRRYAPPATALSRMETGAVERCLPSGATL